MKKVLLLLVFSLSLVFSSLYANSMKFEHLVNFPTQSKNFTVVDDYVYAISEDGTFINAYDIKQKKQLQNFASYQMSVKIAVTANDTHLFVLEKSFSHIFDQEVVNIIVFDISDRENPQQIAYNEIKEYYGEPQDIKYNATTHTIALAWGGQSMIEVFEFDALVQGKVIRKTSRSQIIKSADVLVFLPDYQIDNADFAKIHAYNGWAGNVTDSVDLTTTSRQGSVKNDISFATTSQHIFVSFSYVPNGSSTAKPINLITDISDPFHFKEISSKESSNIMLAAANNQLLIKRDNKLVLKDASQPQTLPTLAAADDYIFQLVYNAQIVNNKVYLLSSRGLDVFQLEEASEPKPVTNLQAAEITANSATLTWQHPEIGQIKTFQVTDALQPSTYIDNDTQTSYPAKNLQPNTTYTFGVIAHYNDNTKSEEISITFTTSEEAQEEDKLEAFITRFYTVVLKRDPESDGLDYWYEELKNGTKTPPDIAKGFFFSEEFLNKNLSDRDFLMIAYKTLLDREYDEEGLNYWLSRLETDLTREGLINSFLDAPEFIILVNEFLEYVPTIATQSPIELPYDKSKLIDNMIGKTVSNQFWLFSLSLDENALKNIANQYSNFKVIGYDAIDGLLVEIDETSYESLKNIEALKYSENIDSVKERILVDPSSHSLSGVKPPTEGDEYVWEDTPDGANWHLEYLKMLEVWEITPGNKETAIGICEGGVANTSHEDIAIVQSDPNGQKFIHTNYIQIQDENNSKITREHATATTGTIGATRNNNIGMSGINDQAMLYMGGGSSNCLRDKNFQNLHVINNSWGSGMYQMNIRDKNQNKIEFHTKNPIVSSDLSDYIQVINNLHENIFIQNPHILYVFAAGNGVENMHGSTKEAEEKYGKEYATDALYEMPGALNTNPNINNIFVVTAHLKDERLPYYANFGASVDIAAPTQFMTLKNVEDGVSTYFDAHWLKTEYGTNDHSAVDGTAMANDGIAGTSFATPVVTGIASLMYSLIPNLTPEQVKSIMINTATKYVTERYKIPGLLNTETFNTEKLYHPIPILNALAAVQYVKDLKDGKAATIKHNTFFNDTPRVEISVNFHKPSSLDDYSFLKLEYNIDVYKNNVWTKTGSYSSTLSSFFLTSNELTEPSTAKYRLSNVNVILSKGSEQKILPVLNYEFTLYALKIDAKLDGQEIDKFQIKVGKRYDDKATIFEDTSFTNHSSVFVKPGIYYIFGTVVEDGKITAKGITVQDTTTGLITSNWQNITNSEINVDLMLTTHRTEHRDQLLMFATKVKDQNGNPVKDAKITLSTTKNTRNSDDLVFYTDSSGKYFSSDIPEQNDFLTLTVEKEGYITETIEKVVLLSDKYQVFDIVLAKEENTPNITLVDASSNGTFTNNGGSFKLSVSPLDENGELNVAGLTKEDFSFKNIKVYNVNDPSTILTSGGAFVDDIIIKERTDNGIALAILIDASGSMENGSSSVPATDPGRIRVTAAKQLVDMLEDNDIAAVIKFQDESAYWLQKFTSDKQLLKEGIEKVDSKGNTPLYTAIYASIYQLNSYPERDRIVVVLADGDSNRGSATFDQTLTYAIENNVKIYAIGLGSSYSMDKLQSLASETGGIFAHAQQAEQLNQIYNQIGTGALKGTVTVLGSGSFEQSLPDGEYLVEGILESYIDSKWAETYFSFQINVE